VHAHDTAERHERSAAEQTYLLAIRSADDASALTSAALARRLGVTPQATSDMLRKLTAEGLVTQGAGRRVVLTDEGRGEADGIFRRHALMEWLLTSVIGLGWAESDVEAMRLQAAVSPRVEAALDALLGHPQTCPHGNPITLASARARPAGLPLSEVESGARVTIYRITEEAEEDPPLLSYLEARALRPGAHVTVLARSDTTESITLDGPRGQATLGLRPASLVRVLPGDADRSLFHTVPAAPR
jgi:DtxR family Mn-dependent transcriptional regulator